MATDIAGGTSYPYRGTYVAPEEGRRPGIGGGLIAAPVQLYVIEAHARALRHPLMGRGAPFELGWWMGPKVEPAPGARGTYRYPVGTRGRSGMYATQGVSFRGTRRGMVSRAAVTHPGIWGLKGFGQADPGPLNPWRAVSRWVGAAEGESVAARLAERAPTGVLKKTWQFLGKAAGGARVPEAGKLLSMAQSPWIRTGMRLGHLGLIASALAFIGTAGLGVVGKAPYEVGQAVGGILSDITAPLTTKFAYTPTHLTGGYISPQAQTERSRAMAMLRETYGVRRALGNEASLLHRGYGE